jgi:hypothetical protein
MGVVAGRALGTARVPVMPAAGPDIRSLVAPLLARVDIEHQPLLIAVAERRAAERYRGWAAQTDDPSLRDGFLACAVREEEIARRVEALVPDAAAIQAAILPRVPELDAITETLFAGRSLEEQFAVQAAGERVGAATWRAFAARAEDPSVAGEFLACAALEEESAEFLEARCR